MEMESILVFYTRPNSEMINKDKTLFDNQKRPLAVTPEMAPHLHNDRRRSSLQVPLENSIAIALLRNKMDSSSKKSSKNSRLMNLNESVSFGSNVGSSEFLSSGFKGGWVWEKRGKRHRMRRQFGSADRPNSFDTSAL
jgi:aspartyl aminopeptidase